MKSQTIQLDALQQMLIQLQDDGKVRITLATGGIPLYSKTIAPELAYAAGKALVRASQATNQADGQ